ncbi:TrbC/VirB2 family protein (plasmid) [Niallia sp. XMNu-256]|uniref:TrbC/VirB2 family protein n=1 Tax=Niallia sp. XMNu-256 TaxID=3082444 RepID=UPI0030D13BE0
MFQKQETFTISEFLQQTKPKENQTLREEMDFFLQTYLKEVKVAKPKQKRKYQTMILKTLSVSLSVLVFATPAFAQTPQPATIPTEVESLLQTIQIICLGLVAGVATICLMLAGAMRVVGLGEKAKAWSTEIIKGTLQVISAPVVVWLLITIVKGILSPLPGFQNF